MELDKPAQYLRQGLSINALKRIASTLSDTDAARRMQQAKAKLFGQLRMTALDRRQADRAEEMAVHGKDYGEKPPSPFPRTVEIERTDSHIPSAPTTASLIFNPERRLPRFA